MQSNTLHKKIEKDLENNAKVTLDNNTLHSLSRQNQKFLRDALKINQIEKRPFSFLDFPLLSRTNFRQKILKNKKFIKVVIKGHPTYYKIKGIELAGDSHKVTLDPTVVGQKFLDILEFLRLQDPSIHNIRIKFESDLHQHLVKRHSSVDPSNGSITPDCTPTLDSNVTVKILVSRKTTQIIIGRTYNPLIYNTSGIFQLIELLSKISYHLAGLSGCILPPVHEWIITNYDFGKDGPTINSQSFHLTLEEVAGGLIRFYSKKMPDGSRIPRLEQIRTPQRTLAEELQKVLGVIN